MFQRTWLYSCSILSSFLLDLIIPLPFIILETSLDKEVWQAHECVLKDAF